MTLTTIILVVAILLLALLLVFYLFYDFYFLRNPVRKIPQGENIIVSPADGTIIKILKVDARAAKQHQKQQAQKQQVQLDKALFSYIKTIITDVHQQCYIIQIMLTPFDVHYQRSPVAGKVIKVSYTRGKFHNAVKNPQSLRCLENEKNEILFETTMKKKAMRVKVIQIAGALARRIVCFVKPAQRINKGQHIGVIKLGSQVSLIIPSTCKLQVREKQYVYGGSTIIAR